VFYRGFESHDLRKAPREHCKDIEALTMNKAGFATIPPPPGANPPPYRIAEVYMFDTCTHKCGYCWLAENGQVLDFAQLEPFRKPEFLDKISSFFLSHTTGNMKWLLQLTGGEPLIAPNLDRLLSPLLAEGNRVAFYTALLVGRNHPGFRWVLQHPHPQVDYVMASFHPEAELDEGRYFEKIEMLKQAGHKVFLRFVGQPKRLHRLEELSQRCRDLDICFYPTSLLSNHYPAAYTPEEKDRLRSQFSSLSQHIQLEGGLDTTGLACYAGSRIIAVNLQTGNITPCITVHNPSLGNVFEDRLDLYEGPVRCPEAGVNCICDVHFQQNIVIFAEDRSSFETQRYGFVAPDDFQARLATLLENGLRFGLNPQAGIGGVGDENRSFYTIDEIRENYRRRHGIPRTRVRRTDLRELTDVVQQIRQARTQARIQRGEPTRIVTPPGRWSYAADVPLSIPSNAGDEIWVRVRARVLKGECGLGLLNRAGTDFQDRSFVTSTSNSQTIFLQVADASDVQSLIIQNSTPDGQEAEILLDDVAVLGPPATL
jgi:organic radical activating enzyme